MRPTSSARSNRATYRRPSTPPQQIGDDTLQANAGQTPMPDSFTHGTSEQRQRWLATGYKTGTIKSCDTFSTNQL
jgi:predicted metalloprotease